LTVDGDDALANVLERGADQILAVDLAEFLDGIRVEPADNPRHTDGLAAILGPRQRRAQHDGHAEDRAAESHPRLLLLRIHDDQFVRILSTTRASAI